MLLGDGSPTRHLRLLTGSPVAVDLIAMEADQTDHPGAPDDGCDDDFKECIAFEFIVKAHLVWHGFPCDPREFKCVC